MVPDGGETVGVPLSEAVAEAVDGLEAEVTTRVEVTEAVPATSMVAEEEGATTTELLSFLYTLFWIEPMLSFFLSYIRIYLRIFYVKMCVHGLVLC
jgi:hypothetical protein